jgi:pimeloyl-ACP methyl ester carboxylesterase
MSDQHPREDRPKADLLTLEAGRKVAVQVLSEAEGGRTVVLCHPAPGSGRFDPDPAETTARAVRLLALDRPGYGESERLPLRQWPTVTGAAEDLIAVLQHYDVSAAGVAGWSAGGRVALAAASLRPDLIDRVVLVGTPAPDEEVPWMPPEAREGLAALRGLPPEEARAGLEEQFATMVRLNPASVEALELLGASDADREALERPGARARLALMLEGAFRQGAAGLADDIAAYTLQDWGFQLAEVRAKTLLLYGSRDPVAGSRHATWWQKRLPAARVEMVPGAGHLLITRMWGRALSHLAPQSRR